MGSIASTLITRCLDNLAKASTSTSRSGSTTSTLAITWLNSGLQAMARRHDFSELEKTYTGTMVVSQKSYTLPPNTKTIYDVRLQDGTSSRKLLPVTQIYFDRIAPYPEGDTTGKPTWYVQYGEHFDVYPVSDTAYTMYIRVQLFPTTITATTDTISYNSDRDDIIVAYMCKEGFQHYQMWEDAALWKKDFDVLIKEAKLMDEDWPDNYPVARGFSSDRTMPIIGDPWNSPFVWREYT